MRTLDLATVPAVVLVAVLIGLSLVRGRSVGRRLAVEGLAITAILWTLLERGASPLPVWQSLAARSDGPWLRALAVVWWLVGARLVVTVITSLRGRDVRSRQARLVTDLLTGLIYVSAIYVIADTILDLPVRTLVATSGVIAVVLGLALQNTLSDLFSGIAVGIEQPFRVGDDVALDSGLEGEVTDMNWRSVRIRTDPGDIATIPNSVVAKATVTNLSRPSRRRRATVLVPVRSHAPAGRIIELLRQSLGLCPDVLEEPEPVVAVKALDRFGTSFAMTFHVADGDRVVPATGQVLRQARRFLRHGGIDPPKERDVRALLRETTLFEGLGEAQMAAVESALLRRHLEPGDTLLATGDEVEALSIVAAGVLEVSDGEADAVRRLGRIGPGEYLGDIAMMTGGPIPVTVAALVSAEVLQLPKAALTSLIDDDPDFAAALERSVRRGLARVERDAAARAVLPASEDGGVLRRLAHFLRPGGRGREREAGS